MRGAELQSTWPRDSLPNLTMSSVDSISGSETRTAKYYKRASYLSPRAALSRHCVVELNRLHARTQHFGEGWALFPFDVDVLDLNHITEESIMVKNSNFVRDRP